MRMPRSAVAVALAMAVIASPASAPVAAFAQSSSAAHAPGDKPGRHGKPPRAQKFAVSGSITAVVVADGTITIAATGGTKGVKGSIVTVTVPSAARIVVDGARQPLGGIAAGYRVVVVGVRTGSVYTAVRVQARSPKDRHTPVASPSGGPTPEPSESPAPVSTRPSTDD